MANVRRYWIVVIVLSLAFAGLVWRMIDLMLIDRTFLLKQGDARSVRVLSIPAYRGMITDRNGEPLAVSTPVDSIWIDPTSLDITAEQKQELAKILSFSVKTIDQIIEKNQKREFVYLKRGLNPFVGSEVKKLNIPGVFIQREFHRFYPEGEVTAQLIGLTNIDDHGQEGIELAYDQWLSGKLGKKQILQDRLGHIIADMGLLKTPEPGRDLALSIDRRLQYLAYRELKEAITERGAESGSIVIMDVQTGEVLAMVNQPSFNPNEKPKVHDSRYRNRAVTDVLEPGSTNKAFSVLNGLINGHYKPNTLIDTSPGWLAFGKNRVQEVHGNLGVLTVTEVLLHSSNVGVTKITLSTPPDSLWNILHKVGYGQSTHSTFPGESSGVLVHHKPWGDFTLATLSFGYGLSVTNLQLAQAYSILAANGIKHPVQLTKVETQPKSERVLPEDKTKSVVEMMRAVVQTGGTGVKASVRGYTIAGKTGTSRMIGPHGYDKHRHQAVFAGLAPATKPRLVVTVVISNPQNGYYAAQVAAPIFSKVMADALRILAVPPDDLNSSELSTQPTEKK
ncbi:MAG: peptidoglycan D,D-transpeptidase FtsI family protein [Gammaproteobacteria bacterium]